MGNGRRARPSDQRPSGRPSGRAKPPRDITRPALNRYNGYKCASCAGNWLTVDLDEGVTPMFSPCFANESCRGTAHSLGYPSGPPPNWPLLIEWYKPITTQGLSMEMAEHVNKGGLMRRAAKDAPAWVKRIA